MEDSSHPCTWRSGACTAGVRHQEQVWPGSYPALFVSLQLLLVRCPLVAAAAGTHLCRYGLSVLGGMVRCQTARVSVFRASLMVASLLESAECTYSKLGLTQLITIVPFQDKYS